MKKTIRIIVIFIFAVLLVTSCTKRTTGTDLKSPKSIVSLSPAATEILFAIGAGSQVTDEEVTNTITETITELNKTE